MARFAVGRESLEDDPRVGGPVTVTTEDNVVRVRALLNEDRRLTFDEMEASTGISRGSVEKIVHVDLQLRKVSSHWVPRLLTEEQKGTRVAYATTCLNLPEEMGDFFWQRIITVDETPLPHYMPETKRQCMQWVGPGESKPVHPKSALSAGKCQLTVFWDCEGIIHTDYCPPKTTITDAYYSTLLTETASGETWKGPQAPTSPSGQCPGAHS